jgi:D-alanine transfer protein
MIAQHLVSAIVACCLVGGGLAGGSAYARALEGRYIDALAPEMFELKNQGTALQAEAFRHPELLVIYGSSELEQENAYHASTVFKHYPTGFTIFPVGRGSTTSLIMLQDLASIGSELRGKKVALSVSPPWFFLHDRTPDFYMANYSPLHLSELIFSTDLSYATKQAVVRQLEQTPKLFEADALVRFASERLLEDGVWSRMAYMAVLPMGKIHNVILETQDRWATYTFIQKHVPADGQVQPDVTGGIDWSSLMRTAEAEQRSQADNNDFGFDNEIWSTKYRKLVAERHNQFTDAWFIDNVQKTAEFADLDLLLRGLSELGAEPLLISQPIPGKYYDYIGISAAARSQYYARLREVAATYGVPVVDFADHDNDIYFVTDPNSHLSRKGWTYYDQALDAFYHGSLGDLARTEWSPAAVLPGDSAGLTAAVR